MSERVGNSATASPPRRRLSRGERERRMLDAGERIFGGSGFRASSMDEIAEASGITKALLYQYFDSKEGLYAACVERARARLFDRLERQSIATLNPAERLRDVVTAYFDHIDRHRADWWILYGDASAQTINDMRRRNADVIARLIRGDAEDLLPAADVEFLAHLIVGAGEQVGRWWLEHPAVSKRQVRERFLAAIQGAIAGVVSA